MITISLNVTKKEYEALRARAVRAALPVVSYILAAALDPHKYAWPEDFSLPRRRADRPGHEGRP